MYSFKSENSFSALIPPIVKNKAGDSFSFGDSYVCLSNYIHYTVSSAIIVSILDSEPKNSHLIWKLKTVRYYGKYFETNQFENAFSV